MPLILNTMKGIMKPLPNLNCKVNAWYLDDKKKCNPETLEEMGLYFWKLNSEIYETDSELIELIKMHFNLNAKESFGTDYLDHVFQEHNHKEEALRHILEGGGYFDFRDKNDKWIRINLKESDMMYVPANIYHRFSLDEEQYIRIMRLYKDYSDLEIQYRNDK